MSRQKLKIARLHFRGQQVYSSQNNMLVCHFCSYPRKNQLGYHRCLNQILPLYGCIILRTAAICQETAVLAVCHYIRIWRSETHKVFRLCHCRNVYLLNIEWMEKNANRYLFQSKHFCTFVKSLTKSTLAFMTVIVLMHADRQMPATHYC